MLRDGPEEGRARRVVGIRGRQCMRGGRNRRGRRQRHCRCTHEHHRGIEDPPVLIQLLPRGCGQGDVPFWLGSGWGRGGIYKVFSGVFVFVRFSGGGTDKSVRRGMRTRGKRKVRIVVVAGHEQSAVCHLVRWVIGDHYSVQKNTIKGRQRP